MHRCFSIRGMALPHRIIQNKLAAMAIFLFFKSYFMDNLTVFRLPAAGGQNGCRRLRQEGIIDRGIGTASRFRPKSGSRQVGSGAPAFPKNQKAEQSCKNNAGKLINANLRRRRCLIGAGEEKLTEGCKDADKKKHYQHFWTWNGKIRDHE